jgi:hypothetical protein
MRTRWAMWLVLIACGCEPSTIGCRVDGECSGGVCVAGSCRSLGNADLAGADGGVIDGPPSPYDFSGVPDGFSPDAPTSCSLNADGTLQRSEAPFLVGLGGLFAINPSGSTVQVALKASAGTWDFSTAVPGEHKSFSQLVSPAGTWWAADFPTATYAERLDDGQALYGVYRATADALELLGVVSEQSGLQQTKLSYATPIKVLQFPLAVGSQWVSESDVSGTASGIFFAAHEKYSFSADARGTTKVPLGSFDTLRLRFDYRQTYGFLVTTRITYLHLAECYGAVARVRSRDNESSADFTQATEYRRLAAP